VAVDTTIAMVQAMFFPNNPDIDFGELTRRVELEVSMSARRKAAAAVMKPPWESGASVDRPQVVHAGEPPKSEMGSQRSFWERVRVLAWCVRYFRTILRRAIAGVYAAEQAMADVSKLHTQTQEFRRRLGRLEGLHREGGARPAQGQEPLAVHLLTNLDDLAARMHALELASHRLDRVTTALAAQVEAITDQQVSFHHDIRFRQRWVMPPPLPAVSSCSSARLRLPTIGVISTWSSRCGIAAYAQSLLSGIDTGRLRVFASKVTEALQADESFVSRCWVEGWDDPLDELFQKVRAADVDAVVLQFNFGFFRPAALKRLLERLHGEGILVFMTLHATMDVNVPGMTARLGDLRVALARVCRLLVHSVHDLNRLKEIGLVENVALFPMGLPQPFTGDRRAVRRSLGLDGKTIVASFGYLLPNKGLPELVRAFTLLHARRPDTHLLMLHALYPIGASEQERDVCLDEIHRLGVQDSVTLVTDFLDEAVVLARLAAADIVVYPYQHTQESASAAVKMGLGSGTAVAVTPLPIFADVAAISHPLPGTSPAEITEGLASLLSDPARLAALAGPQRAWIAAHDWATVSARLDGMIRGEVWASASRGDRRAETLPRG
jgi:glycosyltransferase involved in cell wall biosynthesis